MFEVNLIDSFDGSLIGTIDMPQPTVGMVHDEMEIIEVRPAADGSDFDAVIRYV
jgi:hypothetical protein